MNPQHPFLSCSFYTSLHTWCISQKWTLRKWLTAKQKKPSPSRLEWIEARKPHRPPHGHRGAWSRNWSIPTDYRILIDSEMIWLSFEQFLHSYFEAWTKSVAFLSCGSRLCAPCWHQQLSTNLAITLISMMSPESLSCQTSICQTSIELLCIVEIDWTMKNTHIPSHYTGWLVNISVMC